MTITVHCVEGGADGGGGLGRYEIRLHGRTAGYAEYTEHAGVRTFTHTVVDPEFEGRGLGSQLISQALDCERQSGRLVRAQCPFVKRFVERNPQYQDLLAAHSGPSA